MTSPSSSESIYEAIDRSAAEPTTLGYFIRDYIGHLHVHMEQLFTVAQLEHSE